MVVENPEKKDLIIESARKIFEKFGYSKASMDDIAKEAGLGKGTIYYYFESKEDIFLELLQQMEEVLSQEIEQLIHSKPNFIEKFKTFIEEPIKYLIRYSPVLLEVFSNQSPNFLKKIQKFRDKCRNETKHELIELLKTGVSEGVIREDMNFDQLSETILSWFLFGDEFRWMEYSTEKLNKLFKDLEIFAEVILFGIIKRS